MDHLKGLTKLSVDKKLLHLSKIWKKIKKSLGDENHRTGIENNVKRQWGK